MKLLRLPQSKVQLGVALPWNVRDENTNLLLSKGHVVENEYQLEALLERGAFVDAEEVKASSRPTGADADPSKTVVAVPNLFTLWERTTAELQKLVSNVAQSTDFSTETDQFARHIVELIDADPDICIYRMVRQENTQAFYYGYAHAVHAAALCVLLARRLNWPAEQMMSLVKAALTMNMTILDLQGQMAAQDHPMRDKQRAAIQSHPRQCVELLEKAGVTDAHWLAAVAQHHERSDGTGYPAGTSDINALASALRLVDIFVSKISPRTIRPALAVPEAIRQLLRDDRANPLATALVKELGMYPPGEFVKLASGELGIVVKRTDSVRAPIVATITDTNGKPIARTVRQDTAQASYAIVGSATDKAMLARLPPERLYGFSTVQTPQAALDPRLG
ncbi:HD-GYP domain-containing protein (c-di-GMP phosphodiesterase class II) [Rhodoferax ferrireducens]|uniref:HD-GYP domain-containing protein (C-di-GMP phosphodiesterase class II) n=2 Tax=Rhodoferax ferrireducens TaxID=192843 RepID=A0ABU2CAT9_9BURK|nr:HD-GYP domain-containing protein (c-di-GMP phosphodiesterase class II) [Rhodoferax ferrireducens]